MNTAIIYTVLSILFMSLGPTINKFALMDVSPFTLVLYNSLLCSLFCLPFIYKKVLKISSDEIKPLLTAGILNGLSMFFLFYGLNKSSPALVSMLNRSYIIFSIFLGAFILKEKIAKIDWGLIVFALLGITLFMLKKEMAQMQTGAFYGLLSGLLFAVCNFTIKNKLNKTSEYITLFSINFITALMFLLVCLFKGNAYFALPLENKVLSFVFLGSFLGSFLGLLLFYASIKTIPFYKANLYRSISPVISLVIGLFFFPVSLTLVNIVGLIILLGAFMIHSLIKIKSMQPKISEFKFNKLEIVKTDIVPDSYKSILVFIKKDREWLMVKNKFRNWEFPGGHKEGSETLYETAQREAFEEAGVEIKNITYVGYYRLPGGHTTLIVTAEVNKIYDIPSDFETEERKFVSEFPAKLSFNDAVYPWLVKNL